MARPFSHEDEERLRQLRTDGLPRNRITVAKAEKATRAHAPRRSFQIAA
jgi:hypothetical protein